MEIHSIGPRDHSLFDLPAYLVRFWERQTEGPQPPSGGFRSAEFELTGFHNVRQVIAWADENAGLGRTYVIYAAIEVPHVSGVDGLCLIRVFGVDPTSVQHQGAVDSLPI